MPAELELRLQQEAETLNLAPAELVQMLLDTWQLESAASPHAQLPLLLEQALRAHAELLEVEAIWA